MFCMDDRAKDNRHKFFRVGKDLDFALKIFLSDDEAQCLKGILEADSKFLCRHNIMDYSLLVGVLNDTVHLSRTEIAATRVCSPTAAAPDARAGTQEILGAGFPNAYGLAASV